MQYQITVNIGTGAPQAGADMNVNQGDEGGNGGAGQGASIKIGPDGVTSLSAALDAHLPDALDGCLPFAIQSAVDDAVPGAVTDAVGAVMADLAGLVSEEVSEVIRPLLCFLKRTTNQARNRKRQTRGVKELMPMPNENGRTRPATRDTRKEITNTADISALSESQARTWLTFLDEPIPALPGPPAANLVILRQAVLDGFRGE